MKLLSAGAYHRWLQPVAWSFAERAAWAAGTFSVNVLLGRFLRSESYGAFVLGQSVFLICMGLHAALILEPLNVLGPQAHHGDPSDYLGILFAWQVIVGGFLSGITLLGAGVIYSWSPLLGSTLLGVAISLPTVLSYCALRTASYVYAKPWLAARGSLVYLVVSVGGVLLLHSFALLSPGAAFVVQGFAALASCVALAKQVGLSFVHPRRLLDKVSTQTIGEHWSYGRWALAASVTHTASSGLYGPLIAWTLGLSQVAIFRVNQILIGPLQHAVEAVVSVLLPWLSTQMRVRGPRYLLRLTGTVTPLSFLAGAIYGLLVIFAGPWLLQFLYHNPEYQNATWALKPFALAGAILMTSQFPALAVRALGRPRSLLWSKLVPAIWFVTFGTFAMAKWGLSGALLAYVTCAFAETVVLLISIFSPGTPAIKPDNHKAFSPTGTA